MIDICAGFVDNWTELNQKNLFTNCPHDSSPTALLHCLQFKESVAQFAQENIAPHASEIDRTNYFPKVRWHDVSGFY